MRKRWYGRQTKPKKTVSYVKVAQQEKLSEARRIAQQEAMCGCAASGSCDHLSDLWQARINTLANLGGQMLVELLRFSSRPDFWRAVDDLGRRVKAKTAPPPKSDPGVSSALVLKDLKAKARAKLSKRSLMSKAEATLWFDRLRKLDAASFADLQVMARSFRVQDCWDVIDQLGEPAGGATISPDDDPSEASVETPDVPVTDRGFVW